MSDKLARQRVGTNIKVTAAVRGIKLPDLARRCGYKTKQTFYNRINGDAKLGVDELEVIAEVLECEPADLLRDPDDLVGRRSPWIAA